MAMAGSQRRDRTLTAFWRGGLLAVLLIFMIPAAHAVAPMVVTGPWHTLALKSDGTVWAWGGTDNCPSLGLGDTVIRLSPVQVPISGVVAVEAGIGHSLALKSDGTLWAWGCNSGGQLGLGDTVDRYSPVRVPISGVVAVAAGYHTLALKSDGTLWAWGSNDEGQLGLGHKIDRYSPVQVPISGVIAVKAGTTHTLALKSDGTVWAWGDNDHAQLGIGEPVWNGDDRCPITPYDIDNRCSPVQVPISRVVAISGGHYHSLALKSDGTLWGWGRSDGLGLGQGDYSDYPAQLPISGVNMAVAGDELSFALKKDGTLWAWGENDNGELGLGNTIARYSPVQVPISGVVAISSEGAVSGHTLALKDDGTVWGWGWNGEDYGDWTGGVLGLGDRVDRHSPTQIPNFNLGSGGHPIYPDICSISPDPLVKNRLVLVVHGWNSNSEEWPTTMANMIHERIPYESGVKWHVCAVSVHLPLPVTRLTSLHGSGMEHYSRVL